MAIEFILPYHGELGTFETIEDLDEAISLAIQFGDRSREADLRELAGRHHGEHGDPMEAARHFARVIEVLLEDHEWDDEDVMTARGFLGRALTDAASFKEAEEVLGQLVVDRERALGPDDRQTLVTRGNLVRAVGRSGRLEEAIALGEALLADRLRVLGPDDPSTLDTRGHLAQLHGHAGDRDLALQMFQELLDDRVRVLAPDDPVIVMTRSNLAIAMANAGLGEAALEAMQVGLLKEIEVFGDDHPGVLESRQSIARHLFRLERYAEALRANTDLIGDRTRVLGAFSAQTVDAHHMTVKCFRALGDEQRAYDHLIGLIPAVRATLGDDHISTIAIRAEYVSVLLGMEELQEAADELIAIRDDAQIMEPSTPLRQWIEDEVTSLTELAESEEWWDEDAWVEYREEWDEDDDELDDVEALPFEVNPRHTGGPFDGDPGDVILVAITDIIPPVVMMATVMDDGYLDDDLYDEVSRLREEYRRREGSA